MPGEYGYLFGYQAEYGDLKTVWRPATGQWFVCFWTSGNGCSYDANEPIQFGLYGDYPLKADFDGDHLDDLAVWRPNFGIWYYIESNSQRYVERQWGLPGDFPLTADFDGDGKSDNAVWRNSSGMWYVRLSSNDFRADSQSTLIRQWGLPGDHPMSGDFDGDGRADLVVWRPTSGNWYSCSSKTNYNCSVGTVRQFGLGNDKPLNVDVDRDGIADFAVWRPSSSVWYHIRSSTGELQTQQWGLGNDVSIDIGIRDMVKHLY